MIRILLYAVNHVGLGHVARLSILQRALQRQPEVECFFFSDSSHVKGFFTCSGLAVPDDLLASKAENNKRFYEGFSRAIETFRPHLVLCDTYWPELIISKLSEAGIRTALIMRMMHEQVMERTVKKALKVFDTIFIPHHPEEVLWTYREAPSLIRLIESSAAGCVGPIARQAKQRALGNEVIFAVGGGGQWPGASRPNRTETQLRVFYDVAGLLMRHGYPKPTLAVGPMLKVDQNLQRRFNLARTRSLYRSFGSETVVVSRGGYNTCWEAVAAGSLFISCGSHQGDENVKARAAFLQHAGLGRTASLSTEALFDAIARPRSRREVQSIADWSDVINAGLPVMIDELLGGSFLRARENATVRGAQDIRRLVRHRKRHHGSKFLTRRKIEGASFSCHADCEVWVDVLKFPGPRLRNELRIARELKEFQRDGVITGLGFHPDRMPTILSDYLLRLFSLYSRASAR